ncbi:hypothetical protein A8C75_11070 [Marinobacterium aestuarii]|uniref:Uncharacterized protein n=1 Tax=Marinobacterium aestuarii TaxID=1821621 RepID=A0A1A9EZ91_9GAMM|nr:hypothetical protein [Marinobacterium aestuarii]ANG62971.1 hypothetical protein A8C75_11070 [Marinobacterium aestuarii]
MSKVVPAVLVYLACLIAPVPASAFCIQNDSEQRLFVEVGDHGIEYRKWIEPGSTACCDWRQENCNWTRAADGRLSVRLFGQRRDAAPACTYSVRANGHLRLSHFAPPGQCKWEP